MVDVKEAGRDGGVMKLKVVAEVTVMFRSERDSTENL